MNPAFPFSRSRRAFLPLELRPFIAVIGMALFAMPGVGFAALDILVIGSTHSYSERGETGVVHEAPFDPTAITTEMQAILDDDPLITGNVNVVFEDLYRSKMVPTSTGSGGTIVDMTYHCFSLAQYFMWPDGRDARLANLRGASGTDWDYIILIEDPYVLANFPGMYAEAVRLYQEEIAKGNAELVLMSQWPKASSGFTPLQFNEHAFRVGDSLGLMVAPAARAWNELDPKDTSTSHPTPNGAYLAAATLYSTLTARNATGFVSVPKQPLTQLAYDTLQTTNSTAQYSGTYTQPDKFQMKYTRKRRLEFTHFGTSTEDGLMAGLIDAIQATQMTYLRRYPPAMGNPIDFCFSRGDDAFEPEKQYQIDPAKFERTYGFPMGDHSTTGAVTMKYGIDKRYENETRFLDGTDLGIVYDMLLKGEVEPFDVRGIPLRLMWSKMNHYAPQTNSHYDDWHMSDEIVRAGGAFMFTLNTGRCPVEDEPADPNSSAWKKWFGRKIGYETAWQMSHMTARVPGFRVVPTRTDNFVVAPYLQKSLSVKFLYPPESDVTVTVSVDDPTAGSVNTNSLTFTPANYDVAQFITVSGVVGDPGDTPFNVTLTTSSDDGVYDGLVDVWDFTNRNYPPGGQMVLLGGFHGENATALQSPIIQNVSVTLARVGSSTAITSSTNSGYTGLLWGTDALDVEPGDSNIPNAHSVYADGTSNTNRLILTVTNHDAKDLFLNKIHFIIKKDNTAALNPGSLTYTSGDLADPDGTGTTFTILNGVNGYDIDLGGYLTDTTLSPGQSAVFTWAHGTPVDPLVNTALRIDNFAISGNFVYAGPDTAPPTPNPMTWASVPAAAGTRSITMTATTASDPSGVEYYFDETSGHPGGSDSGWQSSPSYTDTGLSPNTSYTYTVKARDKSAAQYQTAASAPASTSTPAEPASPVLLGGFYGQNVTALQSPTIHNVSVTLTRIGNSTSITSGNSQCNSLLWGTAALDVAPTDSYSPYDHAIFAEGADKANRLILTVTNHGSNNLVLDKIHFFIRKDQTAALNPSTLTYTSGDLADADGTGTTFTILYGNSGYDIGLSTFLSDTTLAPGESAVFTWAHGTPVDPLVNTAIRVDNFAISGNTAPVPSDHFDAWAASGTGVTFNGDTNRDGVTDGLAWLLGSPDPDANARTLLPQAEVENDDLILSFRFLQPQARGNAALKLQFSNDLGGNDPWETHTVTVPENSGTVGGVVFTITPVEGTDLNDVRAAVPASAAQATGRLFGRLLGNRAAP